MDSFHAEQVPALANGSHVLDLAGNKINKRGQFNIEYFDLHVVYTNLSTAKRPDVQSDAALLPFSNESFDVVICAELLEHIQYPPAVLREAFRVLCEGGVLLICVPFLFQIHGDPYDFGRYTDYYWLNHLKSIGFKDIEIKKQGLFWSVLTDMIRAWWYELDKSGKLSFRKIAFRLIALFKRLAVQRDAQPETQAHPLFSSFTTGFGICATKE